MCVDRPSTSVINPCVKKSTTTKQQNKSPSKNEALRLVLLAGTRKAPFGTHEAQAFVPLGKGASD